MRGILFLAVVMCSTFAVAQECELCNLSNGQASAQCVDGFCGIESLPPSASVAGVAAIPLMPLVIQSAAVPARASAAIVRRTAVRTQNVIAFFRDDRPIRSMFRARPVRRFVGRLFCR